MEQKTNGVASLFQKLRIVELSFVFPVKNTNNYDAKISYFGLISDPLSIQIVSCIMQLSARELHRSPIFK